MITDFSSFKKVHFIGVGGIGISAIARLLLHEGKQVTGTDRAGSEVTEGLIKAGATVFIDQSTSHIPADCDLVIYTVAIPADHPELIEAKKRGLPLMTYPESLKIISAQKYTIAVSGTHGKTTTTAMIASVFIAAQKEPTVLVGSLVKDPLTHELTNFIVGNSQYFIVEADEYKKSFHNINPSILVINNIDADHLDFYKDLADIQASFNELARKVPATGFIVCNPHDPHVVPALENAQATIIDYTSYREAANTLALPVPGDHNRSNAAVALAVAATQSISTDIAAKALAHFEGPWRRFEYKGTLANGALVYDDYAHNPKKVQAVIQGAREKFPDHKLIVAFQPHLYSRTKLLFEEFSHSFNGADQVILVPIYAAREPLDPSITSSMLADALTQQNINAVAVNDLEAAQKAIIDAANERTVVLVVGAGDITDLASILIEKSLK